jgi:hypothetical protein
MHSAEWISARDIFSQILRHCVSIIRMEKTTTIHEEQNKAVPLHAMEALG